MTFGSRERKAWSKEFEEETEKKKADGNERKRTARIKGRLLWLNPW
ncbi:MAG: hypothetical protein A4E32_00197 [Methanomassiliicoccales archaeon PtaU1.Bin124]|nr:MAG: hypothetical protein A4E32_00197 [Methanomassiliicoccales archaeon PtaU1.Bin124]